MRVEPPVAGIGVGLQDPGEGLQMFDRVSAPTVTVNRYGDFDIGV